MKNNLNLSIILVAGLFAIAGCGGNQPVPSGNMEPVNAKTTTTPIYVEAVDLGKEYKSNAQAADKKYKDHYIAARGTINSLNKSPMKITLNGGDMMSILCNVDDMSQEKFEALHVGDSVTVIGTNEGLKGSTFVSLKKCFKF